MKCDIKTMIGSGLVGRCAIGRRVLCFGEADIRQLQRMRTWREKEGASEEDDTKKEEGQVQYDEWERGIVDLSTSILVAPFVLSRDDSLVGVMLMSRLPLPLQYTCNTLQHTHLPPPSQSPLQPAPSVALKDGGGGRGGGHGGSQVAGGGGREGGGQKSRGFDKYDETMAVKLADGVVGVMHSKLILEATTESAQLQQRLHAATQAIFTTLVAIQQHHAEEPTTNRRRRGASPTKSTGQSHGDKGGGDEDAGAASASATTSSATPRKNPPSLHASIIRQTLRLLEADECYLLVPGSGGGRGGDVISVHDALRAARSYVYIVHECMHACIQYVYTNI